MDKIFYFSYLLRVWRVVRDDELVWVASLEDPRTGKRQSFTTLEDLYAFLLKDVRQFNVQSRPRTSRSKSPQAPSRKRNKKTNPFTKGGNAITKYHLIVTAVAAPASTVTGCRVRIQPGRSRGLQQRMPGSDPNAGNPGGVRSLSLAAKNSNPVMWEYVLPV